MQQQKMSRYSVIPGVMVEHDGSTSQPGVRECQPPPVLVLMSPDSSPKGVYPEKRLWVRVNAVKTWQASVIMLPGNDAKRKLLTTKLVMSGTFFKMIPVAKSLLLTGRVLIIAAPAGVSAGNFREKPTRSATEQTSLKKIRTLSTRVSSALKE